MEIVCEKAARYVETLLPPFSPILERLEKEGQEEGIPYLLPCSAQFIRVLLGMLRPRRILEIGTAIGYSAIHMAEAAPEAHIVTLEIDAKMAERARRNFTAAGVSDRVEVVLGDARETLRKLTGPFDFLFIDAQKRDYPVYLEYSLPLLRPGGAILLDNVFFRGMVMEEEETWDPKYRSMLKKLKGFNESLAKREDLETVFLPIGDGLALSYKMG